MEHFIEINKNKLSDNDLVMTDKGWIAVIDLKEGDNIINFEGKIIKIKRILSCKERPDTPILGSTK